MTSELEETLAGQLRMRGIKGFEREHRFHSTRRWRLDFYFPTSRLGVEVDGGLYSNGRHSRGQGAEADNEKLNAAIMCGIAVMRFGPNQVKSGRAADAILAYLEREAA